MNPCCKYRQRSRYKSCFVLYMKVCNITYVLDAYKLVTMDLVMKAYVLVTADSEQSLGVARQ